jgi:hypothetical protein
MATVNTKEKNMPRNYDTDEMTPNTEQDSPAAPTNERKLLRGGWQQVDALKSLDSNYAQRLKVGEDVQIIKFIDDEPYAAWHQHWIERDGQKSFVCIRELEERGCPICELGNRPSQRVAFNVALLSTGSTPTLRSLEIGPRVVDQLRNLNKAPQTGPLTKHYWAISRTGKGATTSYNLQVIRERDIAEEWKIEPISETVFSKIKEEKYDSSIIKVPTYSELLAIASEDLGN